MMNPATTMPIAVPTQSIKLYSSSPSLIKIHPLAREADNKGSSSRLYLLLANESYYPFGACVVSSTINFMPGTGKS
jgi:hypothetical protein